MSKISKIDKLVNSLFSRCSKADLIIFKRRRKTSTFLILQILIQQVISTNNLGLWNAFLNITNTSRALWPTASAICQARHKLSWLLFRKFFYFSVRFFQKSYANNFLWNGRRIFAIDGTKLTLPRSFVRLKYFLHKGAHYPQGMLTVLYQLRASIPFDFVFSRHENERTAATRLIKKLNPLDIVVLDRGFFLKNC